MVPYSAVSRGWIYDNTYTAGDKMILVADDHADTRRVMVRLLEMEGYRVLGVEDGLQALGFLKTYRPSLVILDYAMPGMNGLDVLIEIRKSPVLKSIPVLMFSAFDGRLREHAIAAGADGYVIKCTMDWPELLQEIRRLVGPPMSPASVGTTK